MFDFRGVGQFAICGLVKPHANCWKICASASDDWQDYQAYIDRFGDQGAFADLAKRRVRRLKAADEAASSDNPASLRSADVVEQAYWDAVKDSEDWQDYQSYIDKFGQSGVFFQLAWKRYGQLRAEERKALIADQEKVRARVANDMELAALAAKEKEAAAKEAKVAKAAKEMEVATLPPDIIETTPVPEESVVLKPILDPDAQNKAIEARLGLSRNDRKRIQQALTALGYSTRGVDGMFGRNSRRAISSYQRKRGMEPTGYLDGALRRRILAETPPPPTPAQPKVQAQQQPKAQQQTRDQAEELAKLQLQLRKLQEKQKAQTALNVPKSRSVRPIDGRWQLRVNTIVTRCSKSFPAFSSAVVVTGGSFSGGFRERNKILRIKGKIRDGMVRLWGEAILLPSAANRGENNQFDTTIPFGPNGLSAKLNTLREGNCKVVLDVSLSR